LNIFGGFTKTKKRSAGCQVTTPELEGIVRELLLIGERLKKKKKAGRCERWRSLGVGSDTSMSLWGWCPRWGGPNSGSQQKMEKVDVPDEKSPKAELALPNRQK